MAGLDTYKDQIAEKASNATGMDKEQIASGIDFLKSHKDRFMEDGTEIVPDKEAVTASVEGAKKAASEHLPNAPSSAVKDFKAAAKKSIGSAVAANMPKELPT